MTPWFVVLNSLTMGAATYFHFLNGGRNVGLFRQTYTWVGLSIAANLGLFYKYLTKAQPTNMVFNKIPQASSVLNPVYLRLFLAPLVKAPGKKLSESEAPVSAEVPKWNIDAAHLAKYRKVCEISESRTLPLLYPQVVTGPLLLHLYAHPRFPFAAVGAVHARNVIVAKRPLTVDDDLRFVMRMGASRPARRGTEVDVVLEAVDLRTNEIVWESTNTSYFFHKVSNAAPAEPSAAAPASEPVASESSFELPLADDIGRVYAAVCGDFNPIHTHTIGAKMFGFPRKIGHAMCLLARAISRMEPLPAYPLRLEVAFKSPVLLPGQVQTTVKRSQNGNITFTIASEDKKTQSARVHHAGSITHVSA
eukprot:gnl/Hemi2/12705_TR4339_c0_g1_i2.p1 gnl/Hemi2/12705_TR4339_c0_g1~~gnl/Hemi2/12705_TR4339_c0_g1_i2.p1  ORF type:complete len:416 (-),score=75.39 gnl/Hemi2/12705_TR4339_c0_g1_i2:128-1216(-)